MLLAEEPEPVSDHYKRDVTTTKHAPNPPLQPTASRADRTYFEVVL